MAFLLQTVASVPHGSRRKSQRGYVSMPPPDLAWQLMANLPPRWQDPISKLMEQLDPAGLEKLCDDSHHDCARVNRYYEPDLLATCGSRLGFPMAPALSALYEEVTGDCMSSIWRRQSTTIAREFVNLIQEHFMLHALWSQRTSIEVAIINADPVLLPALIPGFVRDLDRHTRSSPMPMHLQVDLIDNLKSDLLLELLLLQDTRCFHERVDGTSALKPATHTHRHSTDINERLYEACCNKIYMLTWGSWLRDELPIWKAAETIIEEPVYSDWLASILNDFCTMRSNAFAYIFGSRAVLVCENPVRVDWSSRNDIHNWDEPAVQFIDGSGWHFWRGLYISPERRQKFEVVTVADIEQESNVEMRRVLIERYGPARYIKDSGALIVQSDKFGTLLRKDIPGDEPLVMVRVRNSTREPDGSYKYYYLRVPPHVQTAHEAVAWTFGLWHGHYEPTRQS